jgi:hypothetical protein
MLPDTTAPFPIIPLVTEPDAGGRIVPLAKWAEEICPLAMEPETTEAFASMPLLIEPLAGGRIVPLAK